MDTLPLLFLAYITCTESWGFLSSGYTYENMTIHLAVLRPELLIHICVNWGKQKVYKLYFHIITDYGLY